MSTRTSDVSRRVAPKAKCPNAELVMSNCVVLLHNEYGSTINKD